MKKFARFFSLMMIALMLLPAAAVAQQMPAMGLDPETRIGKLPNGLTYYIRHNEYPKGQADFYIAQKVGSILEEDNQRGLAHFLEHMCFNGTTHFPGKDLINYLESIGVKFGANLNAATGMEQTIYNITNVPTARTGAQDSCLLILHDWANDLLLEPAEIDAERKVIHEEWRRSMTGEMRILEKLLPVIYPNSRYGVRLPIGTMEVVDNFPYQALRDYYETWYRPDQQGIIVVGDIDVDRIEGKIKELFSDIEMPENPKVRTTFPIDDNKGTIYAIGHDPEQTRSIVQLMIKTDPMPREMRNTMAFYVQNYITRMISMMYGTRLDEISSKPDAPFAAAGIYYGNFFWADTKDAISVGLIPKKTEEMPQALAAAYRELLRGSRNGFTVTEFERAKAEYLSGYERAYNNRNQRQNSTFVNACLQNFMENEPMPTPEETYETVKQIAAMIPLEAINQTIKGLVTDDNRVLLAMMPDNKEGVYPTEQQFADALAAVDKEEIEAYKEVVKAEPLIEKLPAAGKIVKEEKLAQWDATEWTLSNGAKVIVKPTKYKDDEILMNAIALGGTEKISDSKLKSLMFLDEALSQCGLGTYSNSDLRKYLSGKQVSVHPSLGVYLRSVSGNSTVKDLETMMELIYMSFTNVNFTPEEFEALQNTVVSLIEKQEKNPQFIFQTKMLESLYTSPRQRMLTVEDIKGADRNEIIEIARQMTANAADYTFTFVGNVDPATLRPLVEKYIACLPGDPKTATRKITAYDKQYQQKPGKGVDTFTAPMETPQTWCWISEVASVPYTMKNGQLTSVASQILSKRLIDIVREKEGAVYSISAQGQFNRIDPQNVTILSAFPMKPEMKDKVLDIIAAQIDDMTRNIDQAELDKVKEYMVKNYKESREKNGGWLNAISGWNMNGVDTFNGNEASINAITVDDVKNFMKQINGQNNYRVVILDPAAK